MNMMMRMLGALPRNASLPVLAILAGWYGGAKYGAPEFVMNSIDGMIADGTEMVGGFLGGAKEDDAAPAAATGGEEV